MSVEQPNTVDFIGTDKLTGAVVLTISDHLDWDREDEHLSLLQKKINTYLAFAESGEIAEAYPEAQGKIIRIEIVAQYQLSEKGAHFLRQAQPVLEQAGFHLAWRQLGPE